MGSDEWTRWIGGSLPVDPDQKVQVKFWGYPLKSKIEKASYFDWSHKDFRSINIIAYRVVKD